MKDLVAKWDHWLCEQRLGELCAKPRTHDGKRSHFQKDADRIIYSPPFRRLQNKTQVHSLPHDERIRNRLTHSIEASTIARSIAFRACTQLEDLGLSVIHSNAAAACAAAATLAHDIGNPPFGHAGEAGIRSYFQEYFENHRGPEDIGSHLRGTGHYDDFTHFDGNAQGFRILVRQQLGLAPEGLQLTHATLAAFLKYPWVGKLRMTNGREKFGVFRSEAEEMRAVASATGLRSIGADAQWGRHPLAYIVEAADDIAYLTSDLEDAVYLGLITFEEARHTFEELIPIEQNTSHLNRSHAALTRWRSTAIGGLVTQAAKAFVDDFECVSVGGRDPGLLDGIRQVGQLRQFSTKRVYETADKARDEVAGCRALKGILEVFIPVAEKLSRARWDVKTLGIEDRQVLRLMTQVFADGGTVDPFTPPPDFDNNATAEGFHRVLDFVSGLSDAGCLRLWRTLSGTSAQ